MPRPEEINHPTYANIQFPDYEYREFPKMVRKEMDGGKYVDVMTWNEDEERTALGGGEVIRPEELKASLIEQARVAGVMIDKRWNPERLRTAMLAAGVTPED